MLADDEVARVIAQADDLLCKIDSSRDLSALEIYDGLALLLVELEEFFLGTEPWRELPTDVLASEFLGRQQPDSCMSLTPIAEIRTRFLSRVRRVSDVDHSEAFCKALWRVSGATLRHSFGRELDRRLRENEDKNGRTVRETLVYRRDEQGTEETRFLEALRNLVLWRTPALSSDANHQERQALAVQIILEELREYWAMEAVGLDAKGLAAIIDGKFNRTAWKIRDGLRAALDRELKWEARHGLKELPDKCTSTPDPGEVPHEISEAESRILIEKIAASVTPRQREFLEKRLHSESDAEAAQKMKISPAAASQLKAGIKDTARRLRLR